MDQGSLEMGSCLIPLYLQFILLLLHLQISLCDGIRSWGNGDTQPADSQRSQLQIQALACCLPPGEVSVCLVIPAQARPHTKTSLQVYNLDVGTRVSNSHHFPISKGLGFGSF